MHLCLTVECITSGLHLSVFLIRSHPPPPRPRNRKSAEPCRSTAHRRISVYWCLLSVSWVFTGGSLEVLRVLLQTVPTQTAFLPQVARTMYTRLVPLKEVFHKLDVNGDGMLTEEEFKNGIAYLRTLCPDALTDADIELMGEHVYRDKHGAISWHQFLDAFSLEPSANLPPAATAASFGSPRSALKDSRTFSGEGILKSPDKSLKSPTKGVLGDRQPPVTALATVVQCEVGLCIWVSPGTTWKATGGRRQDWA